MEYRKQRNITFTPEQENFAKENYGKMEHKQLAKLIGVKYGKTLINLKLMGLHVTKNEIEKGQSYSFCKVVKFKKYFDIDGFGKYYNY